MPEQRALWVSTSTQTRGGIATYVTAVQQAPLWRDWNIRHVTTHRDGSKLVKLAAFASGAVQFIIELVRFRPTIVHLHSSADASFVRKGILLWISEIAGVPTVLHIHGSDFHEFFARSPRPLQAVIRSTLRRASAVIALGETWAARLRAIAPDARVSVIPNAVRPAYQCTQPDRGEPVGVAFLGRIGERKGTFRLLDAWALMHTDVATLTIAGDGEVERARRRIADLRLNGTVALYEWLSQSAVSELLGRCQVLVLPSRNEGQPMAVLEAMARGLCIVAGDAGGLPEMLGDGCGVLVAPDDVDGIAAALHLVIHDAGLRARCGEAAYARVKDRYDIEAVSRQLEALYREVAQ